MKKLLCLLLAFSFLLSFTACFEKDKPNDEPSVTDVPTATEPTATEPTATEPTATEPTASEPTATEPTATEPTATEPTASEPTESGSTERPTVVGDKTIRISLSEYVSGDMPITAYQYIQGPDRTGSNAVMDAIYERNQSVSAKTGIKPVYCYTNLDYYQITDDIGVGSNMPLEDMPDLYVNQIYGMVRAQMKGFLRNLYDTATPNHFDFGTDKTQNVNGYYNTFMNAFNFASSEKMYILAGDYFTDVVRNLNLTAVNVTDFDAYFLKGDANRPELGTGRDYLYNTVESGEWTVDKMIEWSNVAYKDTNNNLKKDKSDRLGVMVYNGGPFAMGFLPSADLSLYEVSEDGTRYTVRPNSNATTILAKWQSVLASKGGHLLSSEEAMSHTDFFSTFLDGNVLFAPGIQVFWLETPEMKMMEDEICLVPYPKVFAEDRYRVLTHDNVQVGGIRRNSRRFEAVSLWIQTASEASSPVISAYFSFVLTHDGRVDDGAKKMLTLCYDHIFRPTWLAANMFLVIGEDTFQRLDDNPVYYTCVTVDKTIMYSSKYQAATSRLTHALNQYKFKFENLK